MRPRVAGGDKTEDGVGRTSSLQLQVPAGKVSRGAQRKRCHRHPRPSRAHRPVRSSGRENPPRSAPPRPARACSAEHCRSAAQGQPWFSATRVQEDRRHPRLVLHADRLMLQARQGPARFSHARVASPGCACARGTGLLL
jgi:hypothetical protein